MFDKIANLINLITVNICQILAMLVILIGVIKALIIYVKNVLLNKKSIAAMTKSRMEIGHSFSLGLAFLIGASIVKTIIAPTWEDIGQLAAIIAIRTFLNYFLLSDVKDLQQSSIPQKEIPKEK